jgi:hypothetical protein
VRKHKKPTAKATAPKEPDKPVIGLTPWNVLQVAVKAVPALRYALGVLGIVSVLAIIKSFEIDYRVATFGALIMLVLMVALVVFAALTKVKSAQIRIAALVMMWCFLIITILSAMLLCTSAFFNYPRPLTQLLGAVVPDAPVDESPKARLAISHAFREHLVDLDEAASGMGLELRNWDEIKSKDERESMLTFSERFVLCVQQFVSESIPADGKNNSFGKGIPFDIEVRKGPHAKQLILRDVFVEVVRLHSLPPTFWTGLGHTTKPVIAIEMRNRQSPLPWTFHANWIADSNQSPYRAFQGEQIEVNKPEWDAFTLKLLALDRGVYQFNISVILQQDDEPATTFLLTPRPLTVGFFARPSQEHPDYQFLHQRYMDRGGISQQFLQGPRRPYVPGLGTCGN